MKTENTLTHAEQNVYVIKYLTRQRKHVSRNSRMYEFLTELIDKRKKALEIKVTELEREMLIEIMQGENDGVGNGYGEFDGLGLTPERKGVLSSLIKKGFVYNSMEDWEDELAQYCTKQTPQTIEIAKSLNLNY